MKENWASERAKKAAQTRKQRYGPDVFKRMGAKGGSSPRPKKIDDLPATQQYEPLQSEPK